jgi:hypothetical protein
MIEVLRIISILFLIIASIIIVFAIVIVFVGTRIKSPTIRLPSLKLARWFALDQVKRDKKWLEIRQKYLDGIERQIEEIEKKKK